MVIFQARAFRPYNVCGLTPAISDRAINLARVNGLILTLWLPWPRWPMATGGCRAQITLSAIATTLNYGCVFVFHICIFSFSGWVRWWSVFFIFILIERKKIVTEWRWCGGYFSWLSKRIQLRWYANNARNVSDRIGTFVDDAHEWFCFGIIRLWGIDIFFMYEFIVRCRFKNKIGFVSEKWFRCNWDILFAAVAKLVEIKAVEILWFHVSLQVFLKT